MHSKQNTFSSPYIYIYRLIALVQFSIQLAACTGPGFVFEFFAVLFTDFPQLSTEFPVFTIRVAFLGVTITVELSCLDLVADASIHGGGCPLRDRLEKGRRQQMRRFLHQKGEMN